MTGGTIDDLAREDMPAATTDGHDATCRSPDDGSKRVSGCE
jgi:hypothetical protein